MAEDFQALVLRLLRHDLRAPMNIILGMADLLRDAALSDDERDYLDTLLQSARGLLAMMDGLNRLAAIAAGSVQPVCQPIALHFLIEEWAGRAPHCVVNIAPGLPDHALGDETRLRQLLGYLIAHAAPYRGAQPWAFHADYRDDMLHLRVAAVHLPDLAEPGLDAALAMALTALMGGRLAAALGPDAMPALQASLPMPVPVAVAGL